MHNTVYDLICVTISYNLLIIIQDWTARKNQQRTLNKDDNLKITHQFADQRHGLLPWRDDRHTVDILVEILVLYTPVKTRNSVFEPGRTDAETKKCKSSNWQVSG